MINIGLNNAQMLDYFRILWSNHRIMIHVHLLNHEHDFIQDVSERFQDGQVDFDAEGDVSRTLELTLADPQKTLAVYGGWETYLKRMVQVYYSIAPPGGEYWYTVPVFCGPIMSFDDNDFSAVLSAAGKDSLGYASVWNPKSWPKGTLVVDIIRYIFRHVMGEKPGHFNIPNRDKKINREFSLKRDSVPWKALRQLYGMLGLKVFYDGRGVAQYRNLTASPVAGFAEHQLLSKPKLSFNAEGFANAAWVEGGDPKGDKKVVRGFAEAPSNHPFSAAKLGRNGVGRYYVKAISDTSIVEQADANDRAWEEMVNALTLNINASWDGVPFPMLEEYDQYQIITPRLNANFRFLQATLPLTHASTMSMGYKKKVTKKVKKRKRRHKGPKGENK